MNDDAKLRFSPEEIRLITDPAWILTKNSIMEKVVRMMARLSEEYREIWDAARVLPVRGLPALDPGSPKISRGENYNGLPWVMLDYPRIFGREDMLAIRTMFWWGHAFSVTLHLKGRYRAMLLPALVRDRAGLAEAGFHVGVSEDEWRHEHVAGNYRPLRADADLEPALDFLKLSARIGVEQWERVAETLSGWFTILVGILVSYPGDEKDPSPGSSRAGSDL